MFFISEPDDAEKQTYPYSITSLADKRDFLQKGDAVKFRLAAHTTTGERRAVYVAAVRQFIRSKVESIKDKVGWWCMLAFQWKLPWTKIVLFFLQY